MYDSVSSLFPCSSEKSVRCFSFIAMASSFLSSPIINNTVTQALREVTRTAAYDDVAVLALLALGGASYLTRGSLWDKPDPYHYKWFERPQESALNSRNIKKETRNIAQKLEETQRDLVIFWGSQSGTAEGFANRLARDCHRRFRLEALVTDLSDYDHETLALIPESKFAIFILSTYGEGDPSDNSAEFWAWLRDTSGASLKQLRYMAFGLGNSNYKYYNKVINDVVAALNSSSASLMLPVGRADDANGTTEEDFFAWKENVFSYFRTSFGMVERDPEYEPCIRVVEDDSMTAIDLHTGEPIQQRNAKKTAASSSPIGALPIRETRELFTKPSASRSCVHMELDLSQTPQIKYKTGDHLAVWAMNPNQEVARLLRVLDLEQKKETPISILSLDPANTKVKVPTPTNALALFQHYLEICAPVSREAVASLTQFAPNEEIRSMLLNLSQNKEAYSTYLLSNHVTLGRLLESTNASWSSLPLSFVIESLPPMTPRYYSISSSSIVSPRSASLTAVVSSMPLPENPTQCIPGLATSYLSALMPASISNSDQTYPFLESGTKIHAHIRKSTFKLPASAATPIIMVAAGTGLAPVRGFLQERARLKSMDRAVGPMLLFFGCRDPEEDFLYKSEIEDMQNGVLKDQLSVITAFSRVPGQPKTYVQDRVEEYAKRLCDLVLDESAVFYICGSANMARDVTKRLGECIKSRNGWADDQLKAWSERQKKTHRWQEDVWG
jgi:NADPH-ferrihemoprotein reductase